MASKKKEIRKASNDGVITKAETQQLRDAGVSKERLGNFQTKQTTVSDIGNKFNKKDVGALKDAGFSNNKILKIAASSQKVGSSASNKLTGLNPGLNLPAAGMKKPSMATGSGINPDMIAYSAARSQVGKDISKQLGGSKKYLQWQGTTAKGKPLALGGFKVPESVRKGDTSDLGGLLRISAKPYKRGSFTSLNGDGTYLGRDGSSLLRKNGNMKNQPTSWMPKSGSGGSGSGKGNKGSGKSEGEMGFEMPSYGDESSSSVASDGSGIFGGTGTNTFNSPTFRRRRSRAQRTGSYTQGPSQLGINLSRTSGLNIMRA